MENLQNVVKIDLNAQNTAGNNHVIGLIECVDDL